jgi:hypothetical protein
MNLNPQQQQLFAKLQNQNEKAGFDTTEHIMPPIQPAQPIQSIPKTVIVNAQGEEMTPISVSKQGISSKIEELEIALGESQAINTSPKRTGIFNDDLGNETFYIKNISNGHVTVKGLKENDPDIVIRVGDCVDLLKDRTLEELKSLRDLRAACDEYSERPLLKRLTPEEYYEEKKKRLQSKKIIERERENMAAASMAAQQQQQTTQTMNAVTQQRVAQPQTPRIRPMILSKLEKLRLSTDPINAHLGWTSEEFVDWAVNADLNNEELDYIISNPVVVNYNNIRTALLEKKSIR